MVFGLAPLRQRAPCGFRHGPRARGGVDLRNRARPRGNPLAAHDLSRVSLAAVRWSFAAGLGEQNIRHGAENSYHRRADGPRPEPPRGRHGSFGPARRWLAIPPQTVGAFGGRYWQRAGEAARGTTLRRKTS